MLHVSTSVLADIASATTSAELVDSVWQAVRLEFSTIPPYLTAMLSLYPGKNREIWTTIHDVVVDEMLHMSIACNLLNALGGRPKLDEAGFLPSYPSRLPLSINNLVVALEPYSPELMKRVFMEIEEPENPIDVPFTTGTAESYATIRQFYQALMEKVGTLGDAAFIGAPARQVVAPQWFGARSFALTGVEPALRALEMIVEEGEGTAVSPVDPDGDFAHYYRFAELWHLRRIARDASSPSGWSFSGPNVPFAPAAVYSITPNQRLSDLDVDSQAGHRAWQFAFVFTKLMKALQRTYDGEPGHLDAAMGLMFELKLAGQALVQLPAVRNGAPTGKNAGPVFEYVVGSRSGA